MVFFTCNSCGESLKKNKVDKHLSQCRSSSISCVDCGKNFTYDYNSHNQCISEDQKYGGLDYKPKENSTKGKTKQEEWVQKVKTSINESNCSPHIKNLLNRLSAYDNIPRKKQKFFNFIKSCLHVHNDYYSQQMWDFFEKIQLNPTNTPTNSTQNGIKRDLNDSDLSDIKDIKKHKSHNDINGNDNINGSQEVTNEKTAHINETQNLETSCESKPKLKIRKIVVQILEESKDNTLSVKKLRKKVIKRFRAMDSSLSKEDIVSKFTSKLNKIKKIEINDEMVFLKKE